MNLTQRLIAFFLRQRVRGGRAIIACSGGADSVALLHLLHQTASATGLELLVAHADHGLRGLASAGDADFVAELAAQFGLPFHLKRLRLEAGAGVEARGRAQRYAWLRQLAAAQAAPWVFTAHHANDQAETVLHHLLRGSHWRGLRGMPARRRLGSATLLRPLLRVTKARLLRFLEEKGQPFREDASNADLRFTRNRLRHQLLAPPLGFSAVRGLLQLAQVARREYRSLRAEAARWQQVAEAPRVGETLVLRVKPLADQPDEVLTELLRSLFHREGWPRGELNRARWQLAAAVLRGEQTAAELPGGVRLRHRRQVIQIWREHAGE